MEIALAGLCIIVALLSVNISVRTQDLIKALDEINETFKSLKK